jgi:hypothetical protein
MTNAFPSIRSQKTIAIDIVIAIDGRQLTSARSVQFNFSLYFNFNLLSFKLNYTGLNPSKAWRQLLQ